jgi:hypothetical protein
MGINPFYKRPSEVSSSTTAPADPEAPTSGDREGFSILNPKFELPPDSIFLDPKRKRALTICNLFINHELAIYQIAELLEEDLGQVVQTLVQRKIVRDRRVKASTWPPDVERRKARLRA